MQKQVRSNQTIVRPNPAVQNTIYAITRNLIAMTITDITSSVALVCSAERVRRLSRNSRNTLRNKNVAVENF